MSSLKRASSAAAAASEASWSALILRVRASDRDLAWRARFAAGSSVSALSSWCGSSVLDSGTVTTCNCSGSGHVSKRWEVEPHPKQASPRGRLAYSGLEYRSLILAKPSAVWRPRRWNVPQSRQSYDAGLVSGVHGLQRVCLRTGGGGPAGTGGAPEGRIAGLGQEAEGACFLIVETSTDGCTSILLE